MAFSKIYIIMYILYIIYSLKNMTYWHKALLSEVIWQLCLIQSNYFYRKALPNSCHFKGCTEGQRNRTGVKVLAAAPVDPWHCISPLEHSHIWSKTPTQRKGWMAQPNHLYSTLICGKKQPHETNLVIQVQECSSSKRNFFNV